MVVIKIGLKALDIPSIVAKVEHVVKCMTGNAHFSEPKPTLAEVSITVSALDEAYKAALDGGKSKKLVMRERKKDVMDTMSLIAAYIMTASGGDREIIASAGMETRSAAKPNNQLGQPQGVKAATSLHAGQVNLSWKTVKGAASYFFEKSLDGNGGWLFCGSSTKITGIVAELPSTSNIWLRVIAVGPAGNGAASSAIKALVG